MINSSIMINTLFKTVEYKLLSSGYLKLNVLTKSGSHHSKKISLNSITIKEGQTTPTFLSWLVILLGCITTAFILYASNNSALIHNNILSIISFVVCVFGATALLCKPIKSKRYHDSFSNSILFEFDESSVKNSATSQFISQLNSAIEEAKKVESHPINLKPNPELQYEIHTEYVNSLLNMGFIDEALYDRICNNMHEKFYGVFTKNQISNNVIYLKR